MATTILFTTACNNNGDEPIDVPTSDISHSNIDEENSSEDLSQNNEPAVTFSAYESNWSNPDHEDYISDEELMILDGSILEYFRDKPIILHQLQPVAQGEELVTLHTNLGDITLRVFPEEAPMAVENFLTHARNGFYDGVVFHRVIPGFMIQGGDPDGTGAGGESIWGSPFGLEPSLNLRHFRGALAMAHAGGAMGSQFYIVQNDRLDFGTIQDFENMRGYLNMPLGRFSDGTRLYAHHIYSEEEFDHFIAYGGTPHLDWHRNQMAHTVFGHVVEGMDVVDTIANVSRGANDRPNEDIIIERISFFYYGE